MRDSHRELIPIGLVIALVAAQALIFFHLQWPLASVVLVIAAVWLAVWLGATPDDEPEIVIEAGGSRRSRVLGILLAVAGMALAALAVWWLTRDWHNNFDIGAPLAVLGIAVWSVGIADADRRAKPFQWGRDPMPRWEWLALLGIVVLAFAFRFYRYTYFPPPNGICAIEEPQTGMAGWGILHGERPWEFLLDRWLAAAALAVGGNNLVALRVPFTIFSALTVIPLYLLLRCLVSRTVALSVALLFVVCHWHLIYARYAHNIYLTTFFVVVLLYLMVRARQDSRLAFYPWIGFLSAYTLYTYAGYRGTTLFVGLFLAGVLVADVRRYRAALTPSRRRQARRWLNRQLLATAITAAAFLVPLLPLVGQIMRTPQGAQYFVEAAHRAVDDPEYYNRSVGKMLQERVTRLRDVAMIFNHRGETWMTMNLPGTPMLDPATGALFTVALFFAVAYPRRRYQGFFATMFLVLLLMGTVFVHNLDVRRLQGIIPLIFVLVALLLERAQERLARRRGLFLGALGVVLAVSYARNIDVYFVKMMNSPEVRGGFHNRYTVAIKYLHGLPDNAYMVLLADISNFFWPSDYDWWRGTRVPGEAVTDVYNLLAGAPGPWQNRELYLLTKEPYAADDLTAFIATQFPGTRCQPVNPPDPGPDHYIGCHVAYRRRPAWMGQGGIRARYYQGPNPQPFIERVEPFVAYGLTPDRCHVTEEQNPLPCRATWDAVWKTDRETVFNVALDTRQAEAEMRIDGALLNSPVRLAPGTHAVQITARFRRDEETGVRVEWQPDQAQKKSLLPFYRVTVPGAEAP
jgi:Dolichyl-phosphate-mannose-protein mannosyltransferase